MGGNVWSAASSEGMNGSCQPSVPGGRTQSSARLPITVGASPSTEWQKSFHVAGVYIHLSLTRFFSIHLHPPRTWEPRGLAITLRTLRRCYDAKERGEPGN